MNPFVFHLPLSFTSKQAGRQQKAMTFVLFIRVFYCSAGNQFSSSSSLLFCCAFRARASYQSSVGYHFDHSLFASFLSRPLHTNHFTFLLAIQVIDIGPARFVYEDHISFRYWYLLIPYFVSPSSASIFLAFLSLSFPLSHSSWYFVLSRFFDSLLFFTPSHLYHRFQTNWREMSNLWTVFDHIFHWFPRIDNFSFIWFENSLKWASFDLAGQNCACSSRQTVSTICFSSLNHVRPKISSASVSCSSHRVGRWAASWFHLCLAERQLTEATIARPSRAKYTAWG